MKVIIMLAVAIFLVMVSSQCTEGISPSGYTCPDQCRTCHDNLTCTNCCHSHYINQSGLCERCHDLSCSSCYLITPNTTNCTACHWNNALVTTSTPATCSTCSTITADICSNVNDCNLTNSCLDCQNYYMVVASQCMKCDQVYPNCIKCDSSRCYVCHNAYQINASNCIIS